MATALELSQQTDESIEAYKKVLELNSQEFWVYKKLADIYYFVKNMSDKTIYYYEKLLEYQPDNSDAKACLSLAYLKNKDYKKGWEFFEYRPYRENALLEKDSRMKNFISSKPFWNGENIQDKTIYVYSEAGFGDTIMFARYLPLLKQKCKNVLFEPEISNVNLFKDSDLGVEIIESKNRNSKKDYDVHTSIMSIPSLLKLWTEEDIPFFEGYLSSNAQKANLYKDKFFKNTDFKIGIKWHGKPDKQNLRAIPLNYFYKLFDLPNVKFYSFQKGAGIEQLEDAKQFNLTNLGETFADFADTAAAIANVDLMICNDTSVAHLAGALGKQCWVLLPYTQDWRWSVDLNCCTWYKNTKLFKQKTPGDWDEVFVRVYEELKNIL